MTKAKISEYNLTHNLGYKIEWATSPRGTQICKAIKDGKKTVYSTNLIRLNKEVMKEELLYCQMIKEYNATLTMPNS